MDVVASSGMCVCVCAGMVAVASAKALLMTPPERLPGPQGSNSMVVFCARTHTSGVSNGCDGPGLFAHGGLGTCDV